MIPRYPAQLGARACEFSECRRHRYTLWRQVDMFGDRFVQFIGLNPSTADEVMDDPTIRRCKSFAARWGYNSLLMTNLFSFRATDPGEMKSTPVSMRYVRFNRYWLMSMAQRAGLVVCAWGVHGCHNGEDQAFLSEANKLGIELWCLGKTKEGFPRHPLYVPGNAELIRFN